MDSGCFENKLELVADRAQEIFAPLDAFRSLDSLALATIDNTENASALFGLGDHDFDGIGGRAKNPANFRHHFNRVEDVNGKKASRKKLAYGKVEGGGASHEHQSTPS